TWDYASRQRRDNKGRPGQRRGAVPTASTGGATPPSEEGKASRTANFRPELRDSAVRMGWSGEGAWRRCVDCIARPTVRSGRTEFFAPLGVSRMPRMIWVAMLSVTLSLGILSGAAFGTFFHHKGGAATATASACDCAEAAPAISCYGGMPTGCTG